MISERLKANHYRKRWVTTYFWRTQAQQEIDYVEEIDGQFEAFEFKWKKQNSIKIPAQFSEAYKPLGFHIITKENFDAFLLP